MCYLLIDLFGLFYLQNSLFWRRLRRTFLSFVSVLFLSVQYFNFCCALLPQLIFFIVFIKGYFSSIYNSSIQLNICYMKSNNIRLRFIATSSRTSMSYFSRLRAILYFSNNTSLYAILMQGLLISNGFIFLDEGHINLSYSTSLNQYGSLICVK